MREVMGGRGLSRFYLFIVVRIRVVFEVVFYFMF